MLKSICECGSPVRGPQSLYCAKCRIEKRKQIALRYYYRRVRIEKRCACGKPIPIGGGRRYCSDECPVKREKRRQKNIRFRAKIAIKNPSYYRENARKYRLKHSEKLKASMKKYQLKNAEQIRERARAYYRLNRKRAIEKSKEWRLKNIEKFRRIAVLREIRRRAGKKSAKGELTNQKILFRVAYYGWRCRYCHRSLTKSTLTLDHCIPLARGGSNWPSNLVPSCKPCNSSKGARTPLEFLSARILIQL